jgi:hypothetical protein
MGRTLPPPAVGGPSASRLFSLESDVETTRNVLDLQDVEQSHALGTCCQSGRSDVGQLLNAR